MKMNRNSIPARELMDGMVSRIVAMIFLSCGHDLASLRIRRSLKERRTVRLPPPSATASSMMLIITTTPSKMLNLSAM